MVKLEVVWVEVEVTRILVLLTKYHFAEKPALLPLRHPMEVKSIGNSRFFVIFVDDYTRKIFVYFIEKKSEVYEKFQEFKYMVENQINKKIKVLRTDNGTEYVNKNMELFLKKSGIVHEKSVPYNPEQNGLAERVNRRLTEKARAMLKDAKLPTKF